MCNVHLIELGRLSGVAWSGPCSSCAEPIAGRCDVIYGRLDDGTPEIQVLRYHADCLDGIEYDGDEGHPDGCFSYGAVTEVLQALTPETVALLERGSTRLDAG